MDKRVHPWTINDRRSNARFSSSPQQRPANYPLTIAMRIDLPPELAIPSVHARSNLKPENWPIITDVCVGDSNSGTRSQPQMDSDCKNSQSINSHENAPDWEGTKADADANRATRANIVFIILRG